MNIRRLLILTVSHMAFAGVGFAMGIYALPILIAPGAPDAQEINTIAAEALFNGEFRRDLKDSDSFHWGEGLVSVANDVISHRGKLAPGPDYKLYLSPEFVETEADFNRLKTTMVRIGDIKTFDNFVVPVPSTIDITQYSTVVVWCETFGQFITAAEYQ